MSLSKYSSLSTLSSVKKRKKMSYHYHLTPIPIPYTGRQHQIRVHLDSIGHRIVGDPIYGLDESFVDDFLNDKIGSSERIKTTGASRLMLHAYYLEFTFLDTRYVFCSKQAFCNEPA